MSIRDIIEIDEALCDGCGQCVPACHEGALAVVDGKLRIVDDARCDGAGACLGHCPTGALKVSKRDAVAFDESFAQAPAKPVEQAPLHQISRPHAMDGGGGCPGSRSASWRNAFPTKADSEQPFEVPSALRQWPVQLHLVSPEAPFWNGRELLLAADCAAFARGGFHQEFLAGRSLAIACPKLDDSNGYLEKLTRILRARDVRALRIVIMEVPCCGGLSSLALQACRAAGYAGEVEVVTLSIMGEVTRRHTVQTASTIALANQAT